MLAQLCRKTPSWQLIVVSGMLLVIATSINAMTMDVAKDKLAPFDQARIQRSVEDPRARGDNVWKRKGTKDVAPIFTLDGQLYNGGRIPPPPPPPSEEEIVKIMQTQPNPILTTSTSVIVTLQYTIVSGDKIKVSVRKPSSNISYGVNNFEIEAGTHQVDVPVNIERIPAGNDYVVLAYAVKQNGWWGERYAHDRIEITVKEGSNIDTDGNIVSDDSNTDVGGGNGGNTDTDTDGGNGGNTDTDGGNADGGNTDVGGGNGGNTDTDTDGGNGGNTDTDGGNTDGGNTNNGNTDGGNSDGGNTDGGNAGNNGGAGAGGTGDNSQAVGGDHQASGGTVGHGNGNGKEETETNVTNSPNEAGTTSIIFIIVALIVLAVVVVVVVVRRRRDENCNNNQLLAKKGKNHNKTYGSSLTMLEQDADVMWSNAFGDVADLGADYSTIDEVPRLHEFEFANLTPDNEYDFASSSPLRAKTKFIQPLLYSDVDATYTLPTKKDQAEEDLYEVIDRKDGTISSFDGFNVVPSDLVFDEMFEPELCDVYEDVSDERAPLFDDYSNASTFSKHKPAVPDRDYSPLSVRNSQSHEQQAQSEESQTSPPLPPRVHVYDKAAKSQVANEKAAKEKKKKSQRPHVYNQAVKSVRTL